MSNDKWLNEEVLVCVCSGRLLLLPLIIVVITKGHTQEAVTFAHFVAEHAHVPNKVIHFSSKACTHLAVKYQKSPTILGPGISNSHLGLHLGYEVI